MVDLAKQAWGKLSVTGERHPLVDHCRDVAVTLRALLDQPLLARLGPLSAAQKDRLAAVAFLHDFGKCNRGFQAKADSSSRDTAGHIMEAMALLLDLQNRWPTEWRTLVTEVCGWFASEERALQMLLASISHHGRPVSPSDYQAAGVNWSARKWWSATDDYDPMEALEALAQATREAFPHAFERNVPPLEATPALQQRFAGLVMLSDWIGSDTQFFPYRRSEDEVRLVLARSGAERALWAIGLKPPDVRRPKPFTEVFGFAPTPLQAALVETLKPDHDNRLLLAESDTGSGKTEAALAWFFRLYAEQKVDGLYFALPTRVAARELYERVRLAIDAAFEPRQRPGPVLLAAPGYVKVDGRPVPDILADPTGTLWDDNAVDAARERLWSAERPKRFLAAAVAVGTIDQALLSVLQVKHSLMRSVCLDRHLLVVDEVHASDPYMREVLCALLRGQLGRGGWALMLSATLGESAAALYFDRPVEPLPNAMKRAYPLLSARSRSWPVPAARERRIDVELSPSLTDDEPLVPALIAALDCGARVLVVCNTVARANALFRRAEAALQSRRPALLHALFAVNGVRCPHHGRFAREDREVLDAAVTEQFGKGSPSGARLLIGTQTLEQSLDIDADWLITDLSPMDVLIQRLGRLHRHQRAQRPRGLSTPKALVRVPPAELASYLDADGGLRAPAGLGSIYADGRVLVRTWDDFRKDPTLVLPQEARHRIERATHPDALDALPDVWRTHGQQLLGRVQAEIVQALRSVVDEQPFGDLHFADRGEQVLTRLGMPTFEIPLEQPMPSPLGVHIQRVAIPAHWLRSAVGSSFPDAIRAEPTSDGFRFTLDAQRFRYTRFGLEPDDA